MYQKLKSLIYDFATKFYYLICFLLTLTTQSQGDAQKPGLSNTENQAQMVVTPLEVKHNNPTVNGFRQLLSTSTGITFTNKLNTILNAKSFDLLNGSGVTLGDYDGDGMCDVFLLAMSGNNRLFRNLGNWKFEDTTLNAGLGKPIPYSSAAVFEDINGDGRLDLIISTFGSGVRTFLNSAKRRFEPLKNTKLESPFGSATLALADVDGDGDLDLYVTNYGLHTMRTKLDLRIRTVRGKPQVVGRYRDYYKIINGKLVEYGEPDGLFLNNGQGIFEPVPWDGGSFLTEEGKPLPHGYRDLGLSAMFRDINQDGLPDIYVCNDFQTPDRIWINQGAGRFQAIARSAIKVSSYSSMGVDFGDLNRDGLDDFMVVDMLSRTHPLRLTQHLEPAPSIQTTGERTWDRPQISRNTLYTSERDGGFTEIASYAGLSATEWSWAPIFMDVDLDGYEDVLIGNGHAQDNLDKDTLQKRSHFPNDSPQQLAIKFPPLKTANLAFRNMGNMQFKEMGNEWGFESKQVSNAIALGDLDNDGDQDVVINCLNAPALVYENIGTLDRIAVRLKGRPGNPRGIGARVSLIEDDFTQSQEIISGGRYLSGDQAQRTFAITQPNKQTRIEVKWRSGLQSIIDNTKANHLYEISETASANTQTKRTPTQSKKTTLFQKLPSAQKSHHSTAGPNSRQVQPTWPFNRSTLGSALAWVDIDLDGDDDLALSGGSQASQIFKNNGNGEFASPIQRQGAFARWGESSFASSPTSSSAGLLVVPREQNPDAANVLIRWMPDGSEQIITELPPGQFGPLAIADVDKDGDLDIFIGGQSPWGKFPVSSNSLILKNDQGNFVTDTINANTLSSLHNVQGAIFCDWDLDGDADLITTSEWGSISWLINENGIFKDRSVSISKRKFNGLWQGLASGDFNEDGRPDLIVCNMGKNTQWSEWDTDRFRIYYSAKIREPETIIVGSCFKEGQWLPITPLEALVPGLPDARLRFVNHATYASKNMEEILGKHQSQFDHYEVNTFETVLLLNLPTGIQKTDVNPRIQWAPSFSPTVADFNNDGHEDVFLSQNYDTNNPQWGRMDSGHGLLLIGDGKGNLSVIPPSESGIRLNGEQRGSAFADFNQDGKMDIAVLERGKGAHVYVNQSKRPGITISLEGPPSNPHCIGAKIQKIDIQTGKTYGPVKEIQSGSGYRSLNSFKHTFMNEEAPMKILVTWPNSKTSTHTISKVTTQATLKQP